MFVFFGTFLLVIVLNVCLFGTFLLVIVLNVCFFGTFLLNVLPFLHDLLNLCSGSL